MLSKYKLYNDVRGTLPYDVECANKANYHVKKVCTINDTVKQNQMIWGNCTQQIRGFGG